MTHPVAAQISIQTVLRTKNPKLARWIPLFMVRAIERLICQRQFNEILSRYSHLSPSGFIDGALEYMDVRYSSEGLDELPDGRYLFASNHPLGGIDGIILANVIHSRFSDAKLVVNDILMSVPPLRPIFVPVNKVGAQTSEYALLINNLYASDSQIVYFPAGLCSRKIGGEITDPEWKKSFVAKAIESRRDIVPIFFEGRNTRFFYWLSNFRKRIGIKFNIEMILLPREMFAQRGKTLNVKIGSPISYQALADMKNNTAAANFIRKEAYSLESSPKKQLHSSFL